MFLHYKGQPEYKQETIARLMKLFSRQTNHYQAYRRQDLPPDFHGHDNPRFGDIVLLADLPYTLWTGEAIALLLPKGGHGHDAKHLDMHGVFFARGPGLKQGLVMESLENVHIYPLIANLLGLPFAPESIDGDFNKVKDVLARTRSAD